MSKSKKTQEVYISLTLGQVTGILDALAGSEYTHTIQLMRKIDKQVKHQLDDVDLYEKVRAVMMAGDTRRIYALNNLVGWSQ